MKPVQIKILSSKQLLIKWSDNTDSTISLLKMRKHCPCATCASEREDQSKSYIPIFSGNQLIVSEIHPVGSYAISVKWKDGHNTGIFEYPFLKSLEDK
jgi:DUF971 family protein